MKRILATGFTLMDMICAPDVRAIWTAFWRDFGRNQTKNRFIFDEIFLYVFFKVDAFFNLKNASSQKVHRIFTLFRSTRNKT